LSVRAKRAHERPSMKPRQGMPWLRGEAAGLPGLRTVNLQRDHRSRLESLPFRAMEDVKGVAFRGLPVGRSRWRLRESRDRGLQGRTHCGYCVHGSHLLPMDHDRRNVSTPETRCATGIMPVAVSLSNAPPTATSSVMSRQRYCASTRRQSAQEVNRGSWAVRL
jgi:hypothetical protein